MSQEYSIPRCLWESLDAVLYSKGVSLAKELAKELGVSPQPLIAQLNAVERTKFTIIPDDDANTYQCQEPINSGAITMRCRQPTMSVSKLCSHHERNSSVVPVNLPLVERVITSESTYVAKDSIVYSLDGTQCGKIKGDILKLFVISDISDISDT